MAEHRNLDVIVVGAGFSGVYQLYKLRKAGFSVKVFEAGSGLGGIWYWNRHPGARVDSDFLAYQFPSLKNYGRTGTGEKTKPLFPDIPGLDTFQGVVHHTSSWPEAGFDITGKRIGVIGTGASGVQLIQEAGPIVVVDCLTYLRRIPASMQREKPQKPGSSA
ncbi:hypothetical protein C0995_007030 [Termitomyces sp. Mi166|nr:hypothetical protein C0995_007030 [Termitomyces sp. Mi166\